METRKLIPFVLKGAGIGIAVGLLVTLLLKNGGSDNEPHTTVEFKEAKSPPPTTANGATAPASYASAVENAAPAVVNIFSKKLVTQRLPPLYEDPLFRRFFGNIAPQKRMESSLGSGVIVSNSGYILTNNHVIAGADEILVALKDGRSVQASVVGTDPDTDLAVLKVPPDQLTSVTIGDSDGLRVGDVVLAIGNPFGVGQTVTMGIVSATGRSQLGISTFENFIQTDAAINPGNSGGALINTAGYLIGINTAIFSRSGGSQGIGFAIPASLAKTVMQQIIEHGRAIRGWLGIEAQDITPELADSFGLGDTTGIIIAGVLRDGPAAQAGLKPGDIITHVDGIVVGDAKTLINLIAGIPPQGKTKLGVLRDQRTTTIEAIVGERPQMEQPQNQNP